MLTRRKHPAPEALAGGSIGGSGTTWGRGTEVSSEVGVALALVRELDFICPRQARGRVATHLGSFPPKQTPLVPAACVLQMAHYLGLTWLVVHSLGRAHAMQCKARIKVGSSTLM